MKPWQQAKKWLLEKHGEDAFEELLARYMIDGLVWSSPTEFMLAKRVRVESGIVMAARNLDHNAWFVHLAAGQRPFAKLLALAPEELDYLVWQRHGSDRYHVWEWDKFKGKVNKWDQAAQQ